MDADRLLAAVRAALDETERVAKLAQNYGPGEWAYEDGYSGPRVFTEGNRSPMSSWDRDIWDRDINEGVWRCDDPDDGCWELRATWRAEGEHIAANDPAAVLRLVAAMRNIVGEVESWRHETCEDSWYSCSQATDDNGYPADLACADDDREGAPCDCGLDARKLRILSPLAHGLGVDT